MLDFSLRPTTDLSVPLPAIDLDLNAACSTAPSSSGSGASPFPIGLIVPGTLLSVANSPLLAPGTFVVSLVTQPANTVFAGPISGGVGIPSFRPLVFEDLPFAADAFIQNQFATTQTGNWWISGHGRIGDYLQIGATSRLTTDFTGTLSITEPTNSDTGDDLRLSKLKFFVQTADGLFNPRQQVANAEIYSADGQHLNIVSPGSVTIQSHTIDFGDGLGVPFFSVGGFNPLVISAGDSGTGSDGVTEFFKNNSSSVNAVTNITLSLNRDNGIPLSVSNRGNRQAFASIGIQAVNVGQTTYRGDLTLNTVDAAVNSGVPTEYFRLKYDGRIIASRYSTLLTAPTTTGVKRMVTVDQTGLFSYEAIPSGSGGSVTSVALQMPSAFSVTNSPITNAGTIVVTGIGSSNQVIRGDGSLGGITISSLLSAVASNSIDNLNFAQVWDWSTLATGSALKLISTSTAMNNATVLEVIATTGSSVIGQTSYAAKFTNNRQGGTFETNVAAEFSASNDLASRNYAARFVRGRVGFGTVGVDEARLELNGGIFGTVTLNPSSSSFASYTLRLPDSPGSANQVLKTDGTGILSWSNLVVITPISSLTNAAAANTIDNLNWTQTWNWGTLSQGGLVLNSISSAAAANNQRLLWVTVSGANSNSTQTTTTLTINNSHTGTSSTNVAGFFSASGGTNNHAIIAFGKVGIGTDTPGALLSLGLAGTTSGTLSFAGSTSGVITIQPAAIAGTYTLTLPINDGNASDVLTTNGTGVLSWTAVSATAQTFQQVLTTGSTLTGTNTVAGAGFNFVWNNFADYTINATNKLFLKVGNYASATVGDVVTLVSTATGEVTFSAPGAGSSGTVTSFSAGDLSPLFTTTETTITTTPALAFALTNAGAHTYFGNNTAGSAAPAYKSNAALTKVDDTNVTLTLGGGFATSLLETASITAGWTGTLGVARGGTNIASYTTGDLLYASGATTLSKLAIGTVGQLLRVNALGTGLEYFTPTFGTVTDFSSGNLAPLFTTSVSTSTSTPALAFSLTAASANTYFGNATTGSAVPIYTSAAALTTVSDTNIILTAGSNAATSLLRAASITATWNGTLGVARGGTNIASYAIGDIIYASGATAFTKLPIGAPNQQLRVNAGATALEYFTASAGGFTLNGLTAATQTFLEGTAGTDFNISSVTSTHTFNIPSASLTARGLVTIAAQSFEGVKTFNVGMVINENGANTAAGGNFRVESDTNTDAISVDSTNNRVGILGAPGAFGFDVAAVSTRIQGNLGVGTTPTGGVALKIGGTAWTSAVLDANVVSVSPSAGTSASIAIFGGTLVEATSGTHITFATTWINPFTATAGLASVTNATSLYVSGPTTVIGANNSAAWIVGRLRLGQATVASGSIDLEGLTSGVITISIPSVAGTATLTMPSVTGTLVQYVASTITSSATPAPAGDSRENFYDVTALITNPTFAAPTGTPLNHNRLTIRIKDNGTIRTLAWNAIYRGGVDIALPTTTIANLTMYLQFEYNSTDLKWDLVGKTDGI